jgi:translocator protein
LSAAPGRWRVWTTAALGAASVAAIGGALTELGSWYVGLAKPRWQPPDALFGPAWTLIFTLCAIAAVQGWNALQGRAGRARLVALYLLNMALNIIWSVLFFKLRRPDWALAEVGALWLSVASLIAVTARAAPRAAWLLAPYQAWVSFAAFLNLAIVRLNGPFG